MISITDSIITNYFNVYRNSTDNALAHFWIIIIYGIFIITNLKLTGHEMGL